MVDLKVLEKKQAASESFGEGDSVSAPSSGGAPKSGGDLLDFDMLGGGEAAPQQNGGTLASKPAGDAGKSDMDLLSEIFSAQPAPATGPGYDPFSAPVANQQAAAPAPAAVNPLDLFGAPPAQAPAPVPAQTNPMDLFGGPPVQQAPAPAAADLFGAAPAAPAPAPQPSSSVVVQGPNHSGLSIEFECSKPDTWNKQKSLLLAKFKNHTNAPIVGLNLQVAVPKYVTLEMQPPTSTTVPPSGNNNTQVTQTINVTNSMLGTKNLMLKLKLGFTANGSKVEHMATQSGFPAGQY